jgi:chemotaxis protein methyltransferase CheR
MEQSRKYEIGIVETRKVVQTILDLYSFDLKDFALTSLKRRIEHVISELHLTDADGLVSKLRTDKSFFEEFASEFVVETTELFRDPSLWRALRDALIPELVNSSGTGKIFVPMISSGEELYSLCILLKENRLENQFQVIASAFSGRIIDRVKQGSFDPKKIENSESNYQKFSGKFDFQKYYTHENHNANWDKTLVENVQFMRQNTDLADSPKSVRLVVFRNKLIYFNQSLSDKVLSVLYQSILPGGYLVLGNKEKLSTNAPGYHFQEVDRSEKIFKKK